MSRMNFARPSWPVPATICFGIFKRPVKTTNCGANDGKNHLNKYTGNSATDGLAGTFMPYVLVLVVFAALTLVDDFLVRCVGAAWGF